MNQLITTSDRLTSDLFSLRQKMGLPRRKLGQMMKCNPDIIRQHELFGYKPDTKTLQKYVDALNIKITFVPRKNKNGKTIHKYW